MVLFLHGMYSVDSPADEFGLEERVAKAARDAGFAVLAPRGELGLCNWSPQYARFACWPSHEGQKANAAGILARLGPALQETSRRLRRAETRPWVIGFSNGGFFASIIAVETRLPIRGVAVLHGGPVEPAQFAANRVVPALLITAEHDEWQRPKMERLHQLLTANQWPHDYRVRPGGHALLDDDVRAAIDFFRRAP